MTHGVIESLENLIDLSRECNRLREHGNVVWWRGHAEQTWNLLPSVFRGSNDSRYENNCCILFRQGAATRHSVCPPDTDLAGWLFLMQHHRLKTRLLDWTESPLVAAFFACTAAPESDGALWILNPFMLSYSQIGKFVIAGVNGPEVAPLIKAPFTGEEPTGNKIVAVVANQVDIRMLAQLSAFTIHQPGEPLNKIPGTHRFLQEVTIPSKYKPQIVNDLDGLGIRLPNIYPDLDHLAEYISSLKFTL